MQSLELCGATGWRVGSFSPSRKIATPAGSSCGDAHPGSLLRNNPRLREVSPTAKFRRRSIESLTAMRNHSRALDKLDVRRHGRESFPERAGWILADRSLGPKPVDRPTGLPRRGYFSQPGVAAPAATPGDRP
jgi:hypothetical protein